VKLDGGAVELLTPENADHEIDFSPDGKFLVDVYSRPDTIPVSVVRSVSGAVVKELQRANISRLVSAGWTMPIRSPSRRATGRRISRACCFARRRSCRGGSIR
jgi:hypothetical protein